MSKAGKVGTIVLFIFSMGAVISALQLVGKLEESRKKVQELSLSLEEKEVALARVEKEKIALEEELGSERKLREAMETRLNQKIDELQKTVEREREEKLTLTKRVNDQMNTIEYLKKEYRETEQERLNLEKMLEGSSPEIKGEVPGALPSVTSGAIGGKVMAVVSPLLSIELDEDAVAALRPTLSIYRKGKLIKEVATKGIRYLAVMARVNQEEHLIGVRENARVSLSLLPGVSGIFNSPITEGKVLDVIKPGFLNLNLGREAFANMEPSLSIYQNNELVREIKVEWMEHVAMVVEVADEASLRGIGKKDIVEITP